MASSSSFGLHSLVKLAASPLPKPIQYAVSSRSRFYMSGAAVAAAMYFGLVHVDWSNGKPSVTVDRAKIQSLKSEGYEYVQNGIQNGFQNGLPKPNGSITPDLAPLTSPATPIDRFTGTQPPTTQPLANPGYNATPWGGTTATAGYANNASGNYPAASYPGSAYPQPAQPNRMVYPPQQPTYPNYNSAPPMQPYANNGYGTPAYGTTPTYGPTYPANPAYGQPNNYAASRGNPAYPQPSTGSAYPTASYYQPTGPATYPAARPIAPQQPHTSYQNLYPPRY